jgi:hypothetical protein
MVNWSNSISRCESDDPGLSSGKSNYYRTIYQQCSNLKSNIKECYDNRPEDTIAWQKCGVRSSPGGLSLDDIFNDCSEPTKEFSCENGQNCFAITERKQTNICDTTDFEKSTQICDLHLNGITFQKCVDWSGDDPNSCNTTLKNPGKIIGWQKCTIGEDPSGSFCTSVSKEFNCTTGHDCYAIFENNSNAKRCDPTTFEKPITNCDGLGNSITVQECTSDNWKHSDPLSCSNSENINQSSIKGWITCKKGHVPTDSIGNSFCNEMTLDNTCKKGLDCFAVTKIDEFAKECDSTTFNGPYTNCEGDDLITYYSCDNWQNSDPNSCFNSNKKPEKIVDWSNYYSGSSPEGAVPGKDLKFFNKNGKTVDTTCEFGKECYPIIDRKVNDTFCVIKNKENYSVLPSFPITKIENGINKNYSLSQRINIGATVFILLLLIISFICLVIILNITSNIPNKSVNLNLSDYSVY